MNMGLCRLKVPLAESKSPNWGGGGLSLGWRRGSSVSASLPLGRGSRAASELGSGGREQREGVATLSAAMELLCPANGGLKMDAARSLAPPRMLPL